LIGTVHSFSVQLKVDSLFSVSVVESLPCVGEERLEEHLVDLGPVVAASRIGEGPDPIGEDAVGPALLLLQDHGGRARAPLGLYTIAA